MFDIENKDRIIQLIRSKKDGAYVSPLYVRNYNDKYDLSELKNIKNFNPSSFRVGFGVMVSIFDKYSFPENMMYAFESVIAFSQYNEEKNVNERFIVFEIGKESHDLSDNDITQQILYYQDLLFDYLTKQQAEYRKQLLEQMMNES